MIVGDHVVDRLAPAQALGVVDKRGGGAGLAHLLELASVLSGVGPGAVAGRIANGVVGHRTQHIAADADARLPAQSFIVEFVNHVSVGVGRIVSVACQVPGV